MKKRRVLFIANRQSQSRQTTLTFTMARISILALLVALLALAHGVIAADQGAGTSYDCTCSCCAPDKCASEGTKDYHISVGSRDKCTDAACRSQVSQCPDSGSHNAGATVTATYHDCTCSCCASGTCATPGLKQYTFDAGSPEKCTQNACASEFSQCPDAGSHNAASADANANAMVFATYQDCMCSCCKEDKCPTLTYSYFDAGSKDKCNEKACASEFYWCPDAGAHNDDTINVALYTGKNAPASAPAAAAPSGLHVTKEKTEMPTYGAALLSIFLIGLFGTVCGLFVYRRVQRERGFRWVQFDDEGRMMGEHPKPAADRSNAVEMNGANGRSHAAIVSPFDKV